MASNNGDGLDQNASYLAELIKRDMTNKIVNDAIENSRPKLVAMARDLIEEMKPVLQTYTDHLHQELIVNLVVRDPEK